MIGLTVHRETNCNSRLTDRGTLDLDRIRAMIIAASKIVIRFCSLVSIFCTVIVRVETTLTEFKNFEKGCER